MIKRVKLNKKKIAKVIKGDATLEQAYSDGKGNYCVIGGLLHAAGCNVEKEFAHYNTYNVANIPLAWLRVLTDTYGLTMQQAAQLQFVNDEHRVTTERRKALLSKLAEL